MCGIVGLYSRSGLPPCPELWPQLVNHLYHRGPDEGAWWADGPFFLGHRRLSIIDLAGGSQPMSTPEGDYVVVFNGEIYNYLELRQELEAAGQTFRTASDTEVLLHGYRRWGTDLPRHLLGMFAFAIADRRRRDLFVARDRFGEKPLFLLDTGDWLAFASELRPLAALPDVPRDLDVDALGNYLCLNYVPGDATLLKSVRRLSPACWQLFTPQGSQSGTYWEPPLAQAPSTGKSFPAVLEEFNERFDRAVRLCLRSDVPVGIFLSGGIDSSLVAEAAMRQGRLSTAYFIDFEEKSYSERDAARLVADRLGLPFQSVLLTPQSLSDFLRLVDHADDPLADSSCLPVYTLARLAATGNKVVLGGDGGDEVFGGYQTYRATLLHRRLMRLLPSSLRRLIARLGARLPTSEGKVTFSFKLRRFLRAADLPSTLAHFTWNGTWLPSEAARITGFRWRPLLAPNLRLQSAEHLGPADLLSYLQRADLAEYLCNDILTKTDRMSMAHGLETRAPFLDADLAGWALGLPSHFKVRANGELKAILRAAARRLFGAAIADRPKQGFSIPIHRWVRGPLAEQIRDLLSRTSVERLGVLDPLEIERIVDDHFSGRKSYGFEVWGLAVLVAWHRMRVQQRPAPPTVSPLLRRDFGACPVT
jgi:asparagine synthase (glutamine-hydrolysing)